MLSPELVDFLKSRKKPGESCFLNENSGSPVFQDPPRSEKYAAVPQGPKQRKGVGNFSAEARRDPTIFYHAELAARNFRSSRSRNIPVTQANILEFSPQAPVEEQPYVHAAFFR